MTEYRLGTTIPMMIPFHRISKPKQFTTTKVVVTMVVIGVVKIAVLMLWILSNYFGKVVT